MMLLRDIFIISTLSVMLASGCESESKTTESPVTYSQDVKPVLDKHCASCHTGEGAGAVASGFQVDTYETVMKGTKFGSVILKGEPLSSTLYRLVSGNVDPSIQMPHGKKKLSDTEVATIETWIQQGANK